ncbi:MAG TPA: GspE/PulE family protein [Tepidisphaeraceae bacterium]|jgi:type II secretory ATPase GspE/PulE/Tfp pilus assembly ATPase PilB-like protein
MTLAASAPTSHKLLDLEKSTAEAGVAQLIERAIAMPASDLFFISNEQHTAVQVRHWGLVRPLAIVSPEQGKRLVSHIKASASMDLTNTRRPLDGRWIYAADTDNAADLRINSIPTVHGEDLAIRLSSRRSQLFDLEYLGLASDQLEQLQAMLQSPGGLLLITGPTGSGKTSTLYACLSYLNDSQRKINTIEDPIEFVIDGLRQSQINPQIDLTFSEMLRGVLRQSPDVIMIGEIRDAETAQIAVHAANSGHLVLASVHAANSPAAIQSMRSFGVPSAFLASSLRGVVSQRLLRTLCPNCKIAFDLPDQQTFADISPLLKEGEGQKLHAARGCEQCHGAGYAGRTGIFELMRVSPQLRQLVADGSTTEQIRRTALEQGMVEFRQSALLKVARGLTTTEEIFRVIPAESLLESIENNNQRQPRRRSSAAN